MDCVFISLLHECYINMYLYLCVWNSELENVGMCVKLILSRTQTYVYVVLVEKVFHVWILALTMKGLSYCVPQPRVCTSGKLSKSAYQASRTAELCIRYLSILFYSIHFLPFVVCTCSLDKYTWLPSHICSCVWEFYTGENIFFLW